VGGKVTAVIIEVNCFAGAGYIFIEGDGIEKEMVLG